jgi:hypothetical protein
MTLKALGAALELSFVYVGEVERGVSKPFEEKHFQRLVSALPSLEIEKLHRLAMQERKEVRFEISSESPVAMQRMAEMFPLVNWGSVSEEELEKFFAQFSQVVE